MRFLHTADWHLGKQLHGFNLQAEQQAAYEQIVQLAVQEKVDAVVIAGDLYDRAVPSEAAVQQLNSMLMDLNLKHHLPLLAISGNHDSAPRLRTGSAWFAATDFYLNTKVSQALTPVVLGDTQFFLLPYFEPFEARHYFEDDSIRTVQQAMEKLVTAMQAQFDLDKKQVLIAHFFAAGSTHVDSETQVTVGGLNAIPVDLLAPFDYVALGHLHGKDALHADRVRYSGSPVKFSISEATQTKGVWIVDTDPFEATFKPLTPLRDVRILKGSFDDLTTPAFYQQQAQDDYLSIQLTDRQVIPNVMAVLREIYPNIINLERVNGPVVTDNQITEIDPSLDPMLLMADFFKQTTDETLTKQQQHWAQNALTAATKED
ncbi:exonuclease sbcCD subunit D [Lactobacillus sp.] [Lactiplantibacillus mudanjiangensis]|uniref:exonuclease SbcCD subunit D n=1 Tax=Lactiplantibacillus mudanjiangensis TaxID=1296538 RepID=UPI001015B59F|nr:exonuclease SbcCD subunit D [Lactiplantibacillus mudanjiangensis]VDG21267.1 exonuclease sbcCD subunit D [Lactobacillus sp.] [Lactiplantibacillus mudanjiangensis]VDG32094.1 exonuclease sbcCD subunit D [Lactobacillus sp.] [Lactiplantibacillus mudanjiangensis]